MIVISHRINTICQLQSLPIKYGVEVDIRSCGEHLIIHHEPYTEGVCFDEWIQYYQHGTLILNVKEEGLEARLIALLRTRGIDDYFFLDQSFPYLLKWAQSGERRCAVRVSEFESIETAFTMAGKVDWIWVDCFTRFPLTRNDAKQLKNAGLKLCIVSPELHGRDAAIEIPLLVNLLNKNDIHADAVCTKRPDFWEMAVNIP